MIVHRLLLRKGGTESEREENVKTWGTICTRRIHRSFMPCMSIKKIDPTRGMKKPCTDRVPKVGQATPIRLARDMASPL